MWRESVIQGAGMGLCFLPVKVKPKPDWNQICQKKKARGKGDLLTVDGREFYDGGGQRSLTKPLSWPPEGSFWRNCCLLYGSRGTQKWKWVWKSLVSDSLQPHGLSLEFSRQEYWSGLPFPSPGDLPNPGTEPGSPVLQVDFLPPKSQDQRHRIRKRSQACLYRSAMSGPLWQLQGQALSFHLMAFPSSVPGTDNLVCFCFMWWFSPLVLHHLSCIMSSSHNNSSMCETHLNNLHQNQPWCLFNMQIPASPRSDCLGQGGSLFL